MGNKLGRRRQVVDEKYTKPQGLYQHKDVDQKKLRKLILDSKLAPCYPGDDDCGCDLEECPICFLVSFLQNCELCCGVSSVKTKEEKGLEQLEEQRVIEAKIRMRQQELLDEEERMLKRREFSSSRSMRGATEVDHCSTRGLPVNFCMGYYVSQSAIWLAMFIAVVNYVNGHYSTYCVTGKRGMKALIYASVNIVQVHSKNLIMFIALEEEFDLDLEDIMVMEAIWLSIQENGKHQEPPNSNAAQSEEYVVEDRSSLAIAGSSSAFPSGGLACAIAALAERQQMSGETSNNYGGDVSMYNMPGYSRYSNRDEQESENYFPAQSAVVVSPMTGDAREWVDHRSEVAEVGISYGGSDEFDDAINPVALPQQDENQCSLQPVTGQIIPESFEEQMMLAMAVSLAEARARTSTPGVAWH
ncbi:UNVERIFIED_CONTAM: E3 ubiquitin-protein ligase DA2 [Sesamum radiatum]|uniref:E3 ubiquitin-protein ligase DA2 n=1 Tax=Sesamum radiatum TaxID=300843 RepID=A0AAW2T5T9_SESRA